MNEQIPTYISGLIEAANNDIRKYGRQLMIDFDEDSFFSLYILTIDESGNVVDKYEFAENYFENELSELVNDAWANVRVEANQTDVKKSASYRNVRKMNLDDLMQGALECHEEMVDMVFDYVKDNGTDCTEYEMEEFGISGTLSDGEHVTKILNFYDSKEGCSYITAALNKSVDFDGIRYENRDSEPYEINHLIEIAAENTFDFTSIHCLYIVADGTGAERLSYYCFTNPGCSFDDNNSEPHHGEAIELTINELAYIIVAIGKLNNNKKDQKQNETLPH